MGCYACWMSASFSFNWLQVLGGAETPHIDQGVRQQLHPIVPLLNVFKTEEQPLELVLPRKRPFHSIPSRMDRLIEQPLASALGALAMARILLDVRNHPRIEDGLAICCRIEAPIEIEIRALDLQTRQHGYPFQGLQPLGEQHGICFS